MPKFGQMRKSHKLTLVLLSLVSTFLIVETITSIAQTSTSNNVAGNKFDTKLFRELVRAKPQDKPFVLLTPEDLSKFSAEEKETLSAAAGDPCETATQIAIGQTINGALNNTDCRLEDGSYADFYVFNGNQGQRVDIRLNSSDFDTYLGLANETGTFVREDDDGGGGTNSRITVTLPETGLYIILANSVFPNQFGNYFLSLSEIIVCAYTLSPTYMEISPAGGTFTFTVNTQNGCQWTAGTNQNHFITVNTASGTGTGTVSFTVSQNGTGYSRGGGISVNNESFQINQPSLQCNFVLTPNVVDFPISGGNGSFTVSVQQGCTWRVESLSSFITASGSGSGNGTVNYTVAANPGADRSGIIRVGDAMPVSFFVNQTGFNCTLSVSPAEIFAGRTGKTGTVSVTSNCPWTVFPRDSFIELTKASGTGTGTFNYKILPNPAAEYRNGTIRVENSQGGFTILVNQIGEVSSTQFDFTGDGTADPAVFRPSQGLWGIRQNDQVATGIHFGFGTDKIVPADYDGNGITDIAVWRPSNGVWYFFNVRGMTAVHFGLDSDIPVPADYDGDGFADFAVYRPSNGTWYILKSSDGQLIIRQFGMAEDVPMPGDFDGDGRADIAVWRPSVGDWYRMNSSDDSFSAVRFGANEDKPILADFDGDGKTDISVWRPSNGVWYHLNSSDNSFAATHFGFSDDLPVAADYDGDGKTDIAVFRPSNGVWYFLNSSTGFAAVHFGMSGDRPIPNYYVR